MKKLFVVLALAGMVGSVSANTISVLNHNATISVLASKDKDKKKDKKDKKEHKCCGSGGCCKKKTDAGADANTPK
jgi:hypothetical protein